MEDSLGVKAELVEGDRGVFDVAVDGEVVFSKLAAGDFIPTPDIVERIKTRQ